MVIEDDEEERHGGHPGFEHTAKVRWRLIGPFYSTPDDTGFDFFILQTS